jgi:putative transposase
VTVGVRIDEIRRATIGNFLLGNGRFADEIGVMPGRRTVPGKPGRPGRQTSSLLT